MLRTPSSKSWEIAVDIFPINGRPCKVSQEKIVDYYNDGRPVFEWERLRQRYVFNQNPAVMKYCEPCPISIFGGLEGCKGPLDDLDVFFLAIGELAPDSPWNDVPQDGTPVFADQLRELARGLKPLRQQLHNSEWPIAQPRFEGVALREQLPSGLGRRQFFAWNAEGPPCLITHNDGYQIFFSKHGLLIKATHGNPQPHTFLKLWREDMGMFGLSSSGEKINFPVLRGRMPAWAEEVPIGAELVAEAIPTDEVFADILDVLEVFCGMAAQYDTGITLSPMTP